VARNTPSNFRLDIVSQKAEETRAPDTSSETKKMTGFKDIGDVAANAPEKASSAGVASPSRSATSARGKKVSAEQQKQEEKDKKVDEALSKVGTEMMKELACLPYEAWSLFFSDPDLRLTEEEAKQLANSYFLIAQSLKPEQLASWKVLLALALLQNFRIAVKKQMKHSEKVTKQKAADKAMSAISKVGEAEVSIV
jgi:hypothetical protein